MNKSESIKELAAALSKAQSEMHGAKKDSTNPFFKSKYADLTSCWEACREPLTKNGLSITQTTSFTETHGMVLITTLLHSSGEWMASELPIRPVKDDLQGLGAAITYLRRFALCAIVGITQDDDDGESAVQRPPQTTFSRPVAQPVKPPTGALPSIPRPTTKLSF